METQFEEINCLSDLNREKQGKKKNLKDRRG